MENERHCPVCGRVIPEGGICDCQKDDEIINSGDQTINYQNIHQALNDFEDYLDDKVAPVLVQPSLSLVINTAPTAPMTADELAKYIYQWAVRKSSSEGTDLQANLLFALGAIVKADQYHVLDSFDGAIFYPAFILQIIELLPDDQIKHFQQAVRQKQEQVWATMTRQPVAEPIMDQPTIRSSATPPQKKEDPFDALMERIAADLSRCDHFLEEGEFDFRELFDQLGTDLADTESFEETSLKLKKIKKIAIQLFNAGQILGTWLMAKAAAQVLQERDNELFYRIVYEAGTTDDLSSEKLRDYLTDSIISPLLAPFCLLFAEFAPTELLLRLMHEPDQSTRHMIYNLIKVYGDSIFDLLMHELQNPMNHPWFYVRNVIALIGELSLADTHRRRTVSRNLAPYINVLQKRQVAIAAIHSAARIGGAATENLFISLLNQKAPEAGIDSETETLRPAEFACKLVEGLCILNTERAIAEVIEIAFGKKIEVTSNQEIVQTFSLEQIGRLDLNIHPILRNRIYEKILKSIVSPGFSIKKALRGRKVREESALVCALMHTRGKDTEAVLEKVIESGAPPEVKEAARRVLEEHRRDGRGETIFVPDEEEDSGGFNIDSD